jgi:hypothetical protein
VQSNGTQLFDECSNANSRVLATLDKSRIQALKGQVCVMFAIILGTQSKRTNMRLGNSQSSRLIFA